ncbi:hypothetical protein [Sinosporangium siamense]|uniref:Uncharacterized protein n=1 Tax=Sinosporangium siamense TaxID=1367973 RepID=A0A919RBS7_9ACTN|nr:hypothetical protein [Sinosporangium siamense]GII90757.1 hypothetical protein Ssi02_09880 [Sinosporangium siamense]
MTTSPLDTADRSVRHRLATVARLTGPAGGLLFLLGVLLHPARDGAGIRAAGDVYGLTHDVQAAGLLLVAVGLATWYASDPQRHGRAGLPVFLTALAGHLMWLAVIVVDGSRNPVMARFAPEVVHTHEDMSPGVMVIVLPGLVLFPLGSVLLARLLARTGATLPGLLIAGGVLVYIVGSLAVFVAGPRSGWVQGLEVAGALPYAAGLVMLALRPGART